MQMYNLKFFDGAFLFYARPAQCKMHVKTGPLDLGCRGEGGQLFPPIFWHKQKKYPLLQIALDYYLPPSP